MLLGLAHTQHRKSIIFRRENKQLRGIEDRSLEMFSHLGGYNRTDKIWRFRDGRIIEFAGVELEHDKEKYQGRPHDLKAFDEITHFTRSQFEYICAWTRSATKGQRTRIVCTGNPPTNAEGDWVIDYWGPWLDERHPRPAKPGELRWYTNLDGKDVEMESGETFKLNGLPIKPMSRTFIPASIYDNPYLRDTSYIGTLQSLPKELRDKFLLGKFTNIRNDDEYQVIPSEWVVLAQKRWESRERPKHRLDALGVDPSRGGNDKFVLSPRVLNYFCEQVIHPGNQTPDGIDACHKIMHVLSAENGDKDTAINIDVIGIGSSVYDHAHVVLGLNAFALNSAETDDEVTDRNGILHFFNKRSQWWWQLREALDPEYGDDLAIPPDRELLADLTAPRWTFTVRGIQVEPKAKIKERIGRSPDKGDSLVYGNAIVQSPFSYGSF